MPHRFALAQPSARHSFPFFAEFFGQLCIVYIIVPYLIISGLYSIIFPVLIFWATPYDEQRCERFPCLDLPALLFIILWHCVLLAA